MSLAKRNDVELKEAIIAQAMESPEGMKALAQALVEPIKVALAYQAIGRKCLMVDELPQGAIPRYEVDVTAKSYVISKRGRVPDMFIEARELIVPTFEIATNPSIRMQEIRSRRYYIVDRAQVRAKDSLQRQEDTEVFKVLSAAVPAANSLTVANAIVWVEVSAVWLLLLSLRRRREVETTVSAPE